MSKIKPGTPILLDGRLTYAKSKPARDGQFETVDGDRTHIHHVEPVDVSQLRETVLALTEEHTEVLENLAQERSRIAELEAELDARPTLDPNPQLQERIAELEATLRKLIKQRR